ncbi:MULTISPECIES: YdcF family protein [unclassified Meiothermus]|uniref:YdcF family protein n=1 Tax=unclassified Meiothermus TaxID=370471 RepID=UPI000D7BED80|nr:MULTISPECIES: YdcF family protein [unclassified Meiothermus]PZA06391.1 hypothetical protein DNA98_13515 [Meiothermus sp. Pnk-1]RYM36990.1 YdcF family protein [Meiothermus sp. PNK-Is4]
MIGRVPPSLRILLIGLLLLAALGLTRRLWLPEVAAWLEIPEPLASAEGLRNDPRAAIVPLAGGRERVLYAAELFRQGYGRWFLATDMPLDVPGIHERYADLVAREAIWQGVPRSAIVLSDQTARTTYEEAQQVLEVARFRGWRSVLVVTSPYHTRRARWVFSEVFGSSGIASHVVAAPERGYTPQNWWQSTDGLRNTWSEYLKLGLRLLGYE